MPQASAASTGSATTPPRVLRKIHAADGSPGVLDALFGTPCHLFDAHGAAVSAGGPNRAR